MTNTNNLKSKVFKAAWTTFKNRKKQMSFGEALSKAWNWAKKTLKSATTKVVEAFGIPANAIKRETQKAILVAGYFECYVTNQVKKIEFWIPKTMASNQWFFNKKVEEAREQFESYQGGRTLMFIFK